MEEVIGSIPIRSTN